MTTNSHNWEMISQYYAMVSAEILSERSSEWAIDPYAWDTGLIRMTPIESWLWSDIRSENLILYPQYPVCGVFVDFANPVAKVAIECDGHEFHLDKNKDAERDRKLEKAGWCIYRISGSDCRSGVGMDDESESKARLFLKTIASNHKIRRS